MISSSNFPQKRPTVLTSTEKALEKTRSERCVIGIKETGPGSEYPIDIWFDSLKSAANVLSPENRELMDVIRCERPETITKLAKLTGRAASNVSRTLKTLSKHNLITTDQAQASVANVSYHDFVILLGDGEQLSNSWHGEAELALKDLAIAHVPEGSEYRAVIDQWLHALSTDCQLYCNNDVSNPEHLKVYILERLKKCCLYFNAQQFHENVFKEISLKPAQNSKVTFIDLFAGIGGMRLGMQANGATCVFSSEFDKQAQLTYKGNYGEFPFGDITKIEPGNIPCHDVLLAGFPCQPF